MGVAMEAMIKITVTTIIISSSEKPSDRCPPLVSCRQVTCSIDGLSITSHHQHDKQGSASEVRVCCVPLRLFCRRYGWKVIGISSNLCAFIGEQESSRPGARGPHGPMPFPAGEPR